MNDKTLGAYKRTTPDPDETTGEALARLAAELMRLLDEVDAELRDEADGGVAAALIEKELEEPTAEVRELRSALAREVARGNALQDALDAADPRPLTPDAITDEMVERAHDYWERNSIISRDGMRGLLAAALPVAPGAMTAREHMDAAWEAAHVPEDGMIPAGAEYITRNRADLLRGPFTDGGSLPDTDHTGSLRRRLLDPPAPARPEGAEEIDEHLRQANAAALGGALTPEQRRALADHLAGFGYRSPIGLAEEDPR